MINNVPPADTDSVNKGTVWKSQFALRPKPVFLSSGNTCTLFVARLETLAIISLDFVTSHTLRHLSQSTWTQRYNLAYVFPGFNALGTFKRFSTPCALNDRYCKNAVWEKRPYHFLHSVFWQRWGGWYIEQQTSRLKQLHRSDVF